MKTVNLIVMGKTEGQPAQFAKVKMDYVAGARLEKAALDAVKEFHFDCDSMLVMDELDMAALEVAKTGYTLTLDVDHLGGGTLNPNLVNEELSEFDKTMQDLIELESEFPLSQSEIDGHSALSNKKSQNSTDIKQCDGKVLPFQNSVSILRNMSSTGSVVTEESVQQEKLDAVLERMPEKLNACIAGASKEFEDFSFCTLDPVTHEITMNSKPWANMNIMPLKVSLELRGEPLYFDAAMNEDGKIKLTENAITSFNQVLIASHP